MDTIFPEKGMPEKKIREKLAEIQRRVHFYTPRTFWRYNTRPHSLGIEAVVKFLELNRNNIGTHTRTSHIKHPPLRILETELILMFGSLMGSTDIDGYITQGGTEGNIMGLWIGRNLLRANQKTNKKVCLLKTVLTHYSVDKAADLLDIEKVVDVSLNTNHGMDPTKIEETLRSLMVEGYNSFLVVLTLGYNATGTIDPIDEIDTVIRVVEKKLGIKVYVHLDAAFGGLVYPFVTQNPFDFRYSSIQSITLDMHKTGLVTHTGADSSKAFS